MRAVVALVVLVCASSAACKDEREAPKPARAPTAASSVAKLPPWRARTYPDAPLPSLRAGEVRREHDGFITRARVMLDHITAKDGFRVALRWEGAVGVPEVQPAIAWRDAVLDTLQIEITDSRGARKTLKAVPTHERMATPRHTALQTPAMMLLHVDGTQIATEWRAPRKVEGAEGDVLAAVGKYRIVVKGALPVGARQVPFETGALDVEVVSTSTHRSVGELERIAARGLFGADAVEQVVGDPGASNQSVRHWAALEDERGNRWLWFVSSLGGGSGDRSFFHVNVTPNGELVASDARSEFTCLAAGTHVATPHGSAVIEALRPGSAVLGWDATTQTEVVTQVQHVVEHPPTAVMRIGDLLVTPNHPVYAGGAFMPAADLELGDPLLTRGGVHSPLVSITHGQSWAVVFDVSVAAPHNFFANGVLVHNKAAPVPGPHDEWEFLFDRPNRSGWAERRWWGRQ